MYTYDGAFKIVKLKVYHRPIGGIEIVGFESVISHIEYNNRFIVSFGKVFAEAHFFMTSG